MRYTKSVGRITICSLVSICYAQEEHEMYHDNEGVAAFSQDTPRGVSEIEHARGTDYVGKDPAAGKGQQGSAIVWQEGIVPPHQSENHQRGNWLKKLEYFRRAGAVYQKNEEGVHEVEVAYKQFNDLYEGEVQRIHTTFNAIGVKEQDVAYVREHAGELVASAQRTAELKITLSKQEVDYQLDILTSGFKDIATLFKTFDDALAKGKYLLTTGQSYLDDSWQKYVAIDSTYNDQQAKVLLEEMQAMNEHLGAMVKYIHQDLAEYCRQRITLLAEHIHAIEQARDIVRKGGFPLTADEFSRLQKQQQDSNKTEKPIETMWSKAWKAITFPFVWIWDGVQRTYHALL